MVRRRSPHRPGTGPKTGNAPNAGFAAYAQGAASALKTAGYMNGTIVATNQDTLALTRKGSFKRIVMDSDIELSANTTVAADATLTINAGKTLTVPSGKTLAVTGTLLNNGTLAGTGTVKLAYGKDHTGTAFSNVRLSCINISNS